MLCQLLYRLKCFCVWNRGGEAGGGLGNGEEGTVEKEAREGVAGHQDSQILSSALCLLPTGCDNIKENSSTSKELLPDSLEPLTLVSGITGTHIL